MQSEDSGASAVTYFAPAERASEDRLAADRAAFKKNLTAVTLLEAMPYMGLVLNQQRQIIAANSKLLQALGISDDEKLLGMRPGEAIRCVHADQEPSGCGTTEACALCGAVNTIMECLQTKRPVSHESRIRTQGPLAGGALDLYLQATAFTTGKSEFIVVALHDISSEKRRQVLERLFFHDVLNTASGIYGLARLLLETDKDPEAEKEYKARMCDLSARIIHEINAQRLLLAAERGSLSINVVEVSVPEVLEEAANLYRHHIVAENRTLRLTPALAGALFTDKTLLLRVLGNLVKNALEAAPENGVVTISAQERDSKVVFLVNNPGVISDEVRHQIFQRSFSTKKGDGRGIGTYSAKLFTERFLGGLLEFTSQEPEGTTFYVTLPKELRIES